MEIPGLPRRYWSPCMTMTGPGMSVSSGMCWNGILSWTAWISSVLLPRLKQVFHQKRRHSVRPWKFLKKNLFHRHWSAITTTESTQRKSWMSPKERFTGRWGFMGWHSWTGIIRTKKETRVFPSGNMTPLSCRHDISVMSWFRFYNRMLSELSGFPAWHLCHVFMFLPFLFFPYLYKIRMEHRWLWLYEKFWHTSCYILRRTGTGACWFFVIITDAGESWTLNLNPDVTVKTAEGHRGAQEE